MSQDSPRILVVDDEVDICHNLTDILSDLGYDVDAAHEGKSALEMVRKKSYDMALLDLKMPGMDGLTLYREIRKISSRTVAIVVTAYASSTTTEEVLGAGAWRLVSKPADFAVLLRLVDEALGQPLVMLVDDDKDLCETLWDVLRDRGFRVSIAHDIDQAAKSLEDTSFNIVLIDIKLPKADGGAVFRLVREANPSARTVLITGYPSETDRIVAEAMEEGADAVCYKPFDVPQLLRTLEKLGGKHALSEPTGGEAGD